MTKKYHKSHKPLKVDQILAQRSAVPGVDSRKRRGVTDGVLDQSTKKRKVNGVSHAEYEKLKQRAFGGETVEKDIIKTDAIVSHDPWAETRVEKDARFTFLPEKKQIKAPKTVKEAPISLLASGKAMPAVAKPKGALSYNPMYQDWDETLEAEGAKEVEAEKKRIEENKLEEERMAKIVAAQNERDDLLTEDESAWEGIESEYDGAEWIKKKRPERKTPAERNKIKRRQEATRLAKHGAAMKKKGEQAKRIEELARELQLTDVDKGLVEKEEKESSDEDYDDRLLRRRRLGKHQYVYSNETDRFLLTKHLDCLRRTWSWCCQMSYRIRFAC